MNLSTVQLEQPEKGLINAQPKRNFNLKGLKKKPKSLTFIKGKKKDTNGIRWYYPIAY